MCGMKETSSHHFKKPHFGLHLTLDGYGGDYKILNSRSAALRYLATTVKRLKMKKLLGPYVVRAKENNTKDPGGYTGFVAIQESHISVHTFPRRGFVSIDVYSCTDFDYKGAIRYAKEFFKLSLLEINVIVRGKKYPMKNIL